MPRLLSNNNGINKTSTNYTATAYQTTFAATYSIGYVDVYRNGVKLVDGSDYTATTGTSIVLIEGPSLNGDVIEIIAFK